jgi:NAD(P)-dependent dehydrogenase (short-subunit alcohol dehydrogenase family)
VELLVNAAGAFIPDKFEGEMAGSLDVLWRSNVATAVNLTMGLEELLQNGRVPLVVNIASTDGVVASAGQGCEIGVSHDVLYATTKGALVTFTRALAQKWAGRGIRVNAVCPTIFDSPMTAELLKTPGKAKELSEVIPLGRLCRTADIFAAITAIYSLEMTTGHILPVDGGYLCQ